MKVLSLFASVLSFVVIVHFTCSMKTDIVVVPEPDMINNYDDLVKPNIRLLFSSISDTLSKFESADPQSKERRAFERSLKTVGGDKNEMIIHLAGNNLHDVFDNMAEIALERKGRTVAPILSSQIQVATNVICYLKLLLSRSGNAASKQSMNYYSWTSQDPNVKEDLLTSVYSAFYKSPYLDKVHKRMKWIVAMGLNSMWDRINDVLPTGDKMSDHKDGDMFRSCKAKDYRQNLPQVEFAPFAPVQFKALTITCGVLLVLSVVTFAREKYKKGSSHPKFSFKLRHNKVAVAGMSAVADRESKHSGRNDAPFGKVVIAVVDQEERQDTPNLQSRVEVAPPMNFFNQRGNTQKVRLPLNTAAGPSSMVFRQDQSAQSTWMNVALRQEATKVFHQEERHDTLNTQSRVEVAPSMKFSHRRSGQKVTCEANLAPRTSERHGDFCRRDQSGRSTREAVLFRYNGLLRASPGFLNLSNN